MVPVIILLIGTIIYSGVVVKRYAKVVERLYLSSFKGMDTERKRIASELHNQLAVHFINIKRDLDVIQKELKINQQSQLAKLELDLNLLENDIHTTVENLYPKELASLDWEKSLKNLTKQLTSPDVRITFESFASKFPTPNKLPQVFWVVQEIIINAIKHAKIKRLQISILDEDNIFHISIFYRATENAITWINAKQSTHKGMGLQIIKDRLRIINAKEKIEIKDQVVSHIIKMPNDHFTH
jgi:signal transduction histidine kinase